MAGETTLTIIGNLTSDPELRFTPSGAAVANFTVASTPRTFDRQSNEWKDGETLFMRCSIWRDAAENVAESLVRGTRVIVTGRLKSRSYETKEGEKRTVIEMDVDEVGPSLRYASAKITKTQRGNGGGFGGPNGGPGGPGQVQGGGYGGPGGGYGAPGGQGGNGGYGGQPMSDPWATGPANTPAPAPGQHGGGHSGGGHPGGGWGNGPSYDEPPF
ncbi:Single-stranded DNA-binding protein [Austwickia sp. TVS 96-490-7B]|uniref:single-stranded DNA-binding protein n=1 Tax=Austwickia sp. TVS 96-490-7B TaxID=2830843 RepID=UPI001C573376|nr:single-stranded DNA-binding protein [Austwickia sp. TVS 96-490-7B]MBW3084148.1 Single-stranded DNA-binding protein [Austwickia sp. TVS 96-490-7B]